MKIFKKISLPRILSVLSILFLASCAATTIPEIYLKQSDIKMELKQEAFGIEALTISRDGQYLLTGDNGGSASPVFGKSSLRFWNLTQGVQVFKLKNDSGKIISVAVSPDNKYAVTGGSAHLQIGFPPLNMWNLTTGQLLKTYERFKGFRGDEFNSISFSQDGKYFLAADWTSIYIFDAKTWKLVKTLTLEGYSPPRLAPYKSLVATFSPDNKYVLSGGPDGIVRLLEIETGKEIRQFHGHKAGSMYGGICSVEFSPDGKYAMTNSIQDSDVILWDIEKGVEARRFSGFEGILDWHFSPQTVSFSPDGKQAFIYGLPSKTFDIKTGEGLIDFPRAWQGKGMYLAGRNMGWAQYHPKGRHVLLNSNDASVRIYDAKTGQEVAILIGFEDGEWLTITSEGYYNASEKGAQYLTVKMGEKDYSVDSFYDVFYRPDIVAAKLQGQDIKDLITITMKDAIKSPPPVVEISSLPSTTNDPKVKVCYQAKSTGGGIGEVRLFHNGKLIESDGYYKEAAKSVVERTQLAKLDSTTIYEDMRSVKIKGIGEISPITSKTKGELFEGCKEVDAISGENEISIIAFNKDNTVQGYMQTAKFNSTIKPEEPHLYILSIGIDQYKDNTINLKYAVKDSKDIKERILKQAETLYKPQNIHHVILKDIEAAKSNIIGKISELSKKIKPTDSFILFVAGHGILLQNQYYMLTNEYDGNVNEGTMISSNEIVEISKKIKSLSQLFIFDTCHAGGVDYIVSGLYDARMSVLAKKMGLHIYASANSKEQAMDGYQGNGLFTYTLLDGLNNNKNADKNKDNKISLTELGEYSKTTTTDISKKIGHAQTPLIINFGKDNAVYNLR